MPDGGTRRGHGADDGRLRERGSIVVPKLDPTPPQPTVRLAGVQAHREGPSPPTVTVSPDEPIAVTVIGRDRDGGMGRARVAIRATLFCRTAATSRLRRQPLVRYVPPPQIARIKANSGTRIRSVLIRSVTQRFGEAECDGDQLDRFTGQAWADTTNASGLDATSRHIHFRSNRDG